MLLEEFTNYCKKETCLRGTFLSKRCKLDSKRSDCFKKFTNLKEIKIKQSLEKDEEWEAVRKEVWERDKGKCRLLAILSIRDYGLIKDLSKGNLDTAHIISRAQAPQKELYYNPNNLVLIHNLFHTRLDQYKHPITGESIKQTVRASWWCKIIGQRKWDDLQKIYKGLK